MPLSRRAALLVSVALLTMSANAGADATTDQCVDANTQAQALRRAGRFAEAREKLRVCAGPSCPSVVQSDCTTRFDEIDKAQPTIAFAAKGASGGDVTAVSVTMDGTPPVDHLDGTALPVDPGSHVFTFSVQGQPPVTRTLLIVEGEKDRREVVDLAGGAASPPSSPSTSSPSAPAPAPLPESPTRARGGGLGTQRVLALVAAAIGVAGVGVGTAFGLVAMSKKSDAQSACPNLCANQDGVNAWSAAVTDANVSTVAFIVGGVGLAGAAVLWLTAPSAASAGARIGLGPGTLRLQGTW